MCGVVVLLHHISVYVSYPDFIPIKREEVVCQLALTGGDELLEAQHCLLSIHNTPSAAVKAGAVRGVSEHIA